jgi:hypothetical protein
MTIERKKLENGTPERRVGTPDWGNASDERRVRTHLWGKGTDVPKFARHPFEKGTHDRLQRWCVATDTVMLVGSASHRMAIERLLWDERSLLVLDLATPRQVCWCLLAQDGHDV